jgi:hypothetical protein
MDWREKEIQPLVGNLSFIFYRTLRGLTKRMWVSSLAFHRRVILTSRELQDGRRILPATLLWFERTGGAKRRMSTFYQPNLLTLGEPREAYLLPTCSLGPRRRLSSERDCQIPLLLLFKCSRGTKFPSWLLVAARMSEQREA